MRLQPSVIIANDITSTTVLKGATTTIPIVTISGGGDPVAAGFAASIERPGGNITGWFAAGELPPTAFTQYELIKLWMPNATRLGHIQNVASAAAESNWAAARDAAKAAGLSEPKKYEVRALADLNAVFPAMASDRIEFATLEGAGILNADLSLPGALATRTRIPVVYANRPLVEQNGGLASVNSVEVPVIDTIRRQAVYVDRILKGAKPGDLAMQRNPTGTREIVINRKAAQAIGLAIPPAVAAKARIVEG